MSAIKILPHFLFYYYVNWVYLVARGQWHNENSFTFVHICQPFDIYYVLKNISNIKAKLSKEDLL